MSYTAKHYVKISGCRFTPGEMIDIPIPEDKLKRLLRLKAVERVPGIVADPADGNAGGDEGDASQLDNTGYDPSDNPEETPDEEEPDEEETIEETEAPEIDVMDGIVSAAEEPAEEAPPKKTTSKGRKKA